MTTLERLQKIYQQTKWPYFKSMDVRNMGATVEELSKLEEDGHIVRRPGINHTIIELLTVNKN